MLPGLVLVPHPQVDAALPWTAADAGGRLGVALRLLAPRRRDQRALLLVALRRSPAGLPSLFLLVAPFLFRAPVVRRGAVRDAQDLQVGQLLQGRTAAFRAARRMWLKGTHRTPGCGWDQPLQDRLKISLF